jgi:hypothetical protein
MFENCPLWKRRARGNVCGGSAITFWKDWNYEFSYTDFLSLKKNGCRFNSDFTLPLGNPAYEILCAVLTQGKEGNEIVEMMEYTFQTAK